MSSPIRRSHVLIDLAAIIIATAALHLGLGLHNATIAAGGLLDTDSYMRLIRVEALWQSGEWYQILTGKLGAPGALSLHWTRPLDVIILLPALLLSLFGMSLHQAIYWIGVVSSPVLHLLACIAAAWAAKPLFPQHGAWRLAALILLLSGAALGYSLPGRPDHHALCILIIAISAGYAIRGLLSPDTAPPAYLAGGWSAFGIWVAPEIILVVAPLLLAVGLLWLQSHARAAAWAQFGQRFGYGMLAIITLGILLEQPPANWATVEYDKISILHLSLALAVAIDFTLAGRIPWSGWRKFLAGAVIAGGSFAVLLVLFPRFYLGSLADIDLTSGAGTFIDEVSEMEPLWPRDYDGLMLLLRFIGSTLIAVPTGLYFVWRRRDRPDVAPLVYLTLAYLIALGAALAHLRLAISVSVFGAILGCGLFAIICDLVHRRGRLVIMATRLASYFIVAIGLQVVGMMDSSGETESYQKSCDPIAASRWLNAARPAVDATHPSPIIMMDSINPAPAIAYFTDYRLVGGPYHRGRDDVADMTATFTSTVPDTSRAILQKRQVDLVLICVKQPSRAIQQSPPESLYHQLVAGKAPSWLTPVPMTGEAGAAFRLFAVTH